MRAIVITKDETDYSRTVTEFLRDYEYRTGRQLEVMDPETPDGVSFCRTYDILEFPTIVALSDDGRMLNQWRGMPLPTINEVSYYS
ncbi:hypothetical protein B7Y94_06140 [Candidatus Saccharibacteria bacterium 32-49-12]|nr:MAG: hypothetical protein B7Y94_06140 [Candidatus Saccharibacteria bacterium 32-49-12]